MEFHSKSMERRVSLLLTQYIRDAAVAHHEYEQKLGHFDEEWANWYARFLVDRVPRFKSPATVKELTILLTEASKKFKGDDWARDYANYILKWKGGESDEGARS